MNKNNRHDLFEPYFKPIKSIKPYNSTYSLKDSKFNFHSNSELDFGPDWQPDFSEKFDIKNNSISLALYTLDMTMCEYNAHDIQSLKSIRKFDCNNGHLFALNILIYYKNQKR